MEALEVRNDPRKLRRYLVVVLLVMPLTAWVALEGLSNVHRVVGIVGTFALGIGAFSLIRTLVSPSRDYLVRIDETGIHRRGWSCGYLPWEHITQVGLVEHKGSTVIYVLASEGVTLSPREGVAASMLNLPRNALTIWLGGTDTQPNDALQYIGRLRPQVVPRDGQLPPPTGAA